MRVIFQTLKNSKGELAIVRGINEHGEFVISHYSARYPFADSKLGTYYTDHCADAIGTAIAQIFGNEASRQIHIATQ